MLIQGQIANTVPAARQTGSPNLAQLPLGEIAVSEVLPRYAALAWSGQVFSVSVAAAAAITAYVGAAGGTPQIAVFNPSGSGKNLVILAANYGSIVAASAAGTVTWGLYWGPTAAITQATLSPPVNALTGLATGSVAKGFSAVALTTSTALTNVMPIGSYYWATAAGAALVTQASPVEIPGYIIVPPGSMAAIGGSSALTSATWISNLTWAEIPV